MACRSMACRSMGRGELGSEGLVGKGEREASCMCNMSAKEQSRITVPQLSSALSHLLFQTQHEAAIRTAFPGQLSYSQRHQIQLTNANKAF